MRSLLARCCLSRGLLSRGFLFRAASCRALPVCGFLSFGLQPRGFDTGRLLTSGFLPLRLQLGGRLSRGFLAFGLLSRGFDASRLLTSGLLPLRLQLGRLLSHGFLTFGLAARLRCGPPPDEQPLAAPPLAPQPLAQRLAPAPSSRFAPALHHRHRETRARRAPAGYAWRCGDVRRWRRWGGGHDQLGLVGGLHVDDGRFRDRSGRRVGGPFGARGRFRSVRIGRGVLLWLGFCRGPGRGNDR